MSHKDRTITRLQRLLGAAVGVDPIEPPSTFYNLVTIGGVRARAHIGDGFITFGVRRVGFVDGRFDGGLVVVPVPKMERRRVLFAAWLMAVHAQAAEVQREDAIRSAAWLADIAARKRNEQ